MAKFYWRNSDFLLPTDFELPYTIFNFLKINVLTVQFSHMGSYFAHR